MLDLEKVKGYLRVTHSLEDDLIAAMIDIAVGMIDGPSGNLGRAITSQTIVDRHDSFPCGGDPIVLDYPPVTALTSVAYLDTEGTDTTMASDARRLVQIGNDRWAVLPAIGTVWPSARCAAGSVRVTYTAGYANEAALPPAIKGALLRMISGLYARRDDVVAGSLSSPDSDVRVDNMLRPFRKIVVA